MNELWPWITLALLGAYHGINPGMGWLFAVALGLQERSRSSVIRAFAPIALGHALSVALVVALIVAAQAFIDTTLLRYLGAAALIAFGMYKLLAPMSHPRWVGMRVNFRDLTVWSFLMATAHGAGLMLAPVLLQLSPATLSRPVYAEPVAYTAPVAPTHNHTAATEPCCADQNHAASECPAHHTHDHDHAVKHGANGVHTHDHTADHHANHVHTHDHTHPAGANQPASTMGKQTSHADHSSHLALASTSSGLPFAELLAVGVHTLAMFAVMGIVAVVVYDKLGLAILRRAWFNLDRMWAIALIGAGVLTVLL